MPEFRVFGPPGTGKTTYLSKQVAQAASQYGNSSVLVASFTRAAAAELVGRGLPIPKGNIGTLHALAYRALERPEIAESAEWVAEWNKAHGFYRFSGGVTGSIDEAAIEVPGGTTGDSLLQKYKVLRARMIDRSMWPESVLRFAQVWEAWKEQTRTMDFTDLIEFALRDVPIAPGRPTVLVADESQDLDKLELSLIRRWGKDTEYMVIAGDDDQCIFHFKGASPDAFLDPPVPPEQKRVLAQSFRVPRQIQVIAERWISCVGRREVKEYKPRDVEGEIRLLRADWQHPEVAVADAEQYLSQGKSVMFLTTCSFMLEPLKEALNRNGVPYHNPFRRKRGDWNPLAVAEGRTSSAERLLAYLRPNFDAWGEVAGPWTALDLTRWVPILEAKGLLKRGAKKTISLLGEDEPLDWDEVMAWFEPGEIRLAIGGADKLDLKWFEQRLLASKQKAMQFPLNVVRKRGPQALRGTPLVTLGTIHSVKGGEGSVVYLFPDTSAAGYREWVAGGEAKDAVIRTFYVGMTRAKETLVICEPVGGMAVNLRRVLW